MGTWLHLIKQVRCNNVYKMLLLCCSEVLRRYADCKLGSEVVAIQDSWIKQCQLERQQRDGQLDLPPFSSSEDSDDQINDNVTV